MKTLIVTALELKTAGRWDIDFHLPPIGIKAFPENILAPVHKCADVIKTKRDPTKQPEKTFKYIDIASIDVETGIIVQAQELTGEEAPSRARKVVHAYDIIISTCRPTRGAIAVIPEELHGQICSTGFSVVRAKLGNNPFYLHFALRLASTLEQFRKWSTGSSYPAILDEDVKKTQLPLPASDVQDNIARIIRTAAAERQSIITAANKAWERTVSDITANLKHNTLLNEIKSENEILSSIKQIAARLSDLPVVDEEKMTPDDEVFQESLFVESENDEDE